MSRKDVIIGVYEYGILRAIQILKKDAYGAEINRFLKERLGHTRVIAQIYLTLTRLKARGLVNSTKSKPLPQKGGRSRSIFTIKAKGIKAIAEVNSYFDQLRDES